MATLRYIFLLYAVTMVLCADAQGIEQVLVEKYHQESQPDGTTMTTYRIFLDMAPGYELQMIYGDDRNQLEISTTTDFFNDTINGGNYAQYSHGKAIGKYPAALDTWLTIGAASDAHWGVPLDLDTDGSIFKKGSGYGPRLQEHDGLVEHVNFKETINFNMESGYLGNVRGSVLHTMNGAWAVMGGTKGITDRNVILVAQITTTGELSFKLNAQLRSPQLKLEKYVSTNAGEDEIFNEGLLYGRFVQ